MVTGKGAKMRLYIRDTENYVDVNYYVKDGVNIATYVYSDGTEYFSPSQLYNMEQRNTQAEEDTQEYEESGDADYIDEEEETSEDY